MFRYERPQKGRLRQFHQVGVEILGVEAKQESRQAMHGFLDSLLDEDQCVYDHPAPGYESRAELTVHVR